MNREDFYEDIKNTYNLNPNDFELEYKMVSTAPADGQIYDIKAYPDESRIFVTYKLNRKTQNYSSSSDVTVEFYKDWKAGKFNS